MLVGAPQRDHSEAVVLDLVKSIRGARIAFVPFTTACTAKYGCAGKPDGGETVRQRAADAARADLDSSTQPKNRISGGEIAPRSGGRLRPYSRQVSGDENGPTVPGASEPRWEPDRRSPGSGEGQGSLQKQRGACTRRCMPLRLEISHRVNRSRLVRTDRTDRLRLRRRPKT